MDKICQKKVGVEAEIFDGSMSFDDSGSLGHPVEVFQAIIISVFQGAIKARILVAIERIRLLLPLKQKMKSCH